MVLRPDCCPRFRGDPVSTVVAEQAEPADEASFTSRNILEYVPGVLLLVAIGLSGKYAQVWRNSQAHQHYWQVPDIEYVLSAIVAPWSTFGKRTPLPVPDAAERSLTEPSEQVEKVKPCSVQERH